ncbi:hypothetical protein GCM10027019_05780 [Melaminivora jejuensis]|uniref:Arm DNA-binding domain-containing protein n=1 Tax=Melaminivora jejuensis TaxID=1267217 RepID=UPI001E47F78F|nr:Arm DNA-binding domain-containing protein [Melaminivora jejuensis]UHJ64191.1 Arm DNA-binding domain-containing protein [Melaminivora jejuensis]
MALTDTFVKNAKPDAGKAAGTKHTDGQGLYLLVKPAGKYCTTLKAAQFRERAAFSFFSLKRPLGRVINQRRYS